MRSPTTAPLLQGIVIGAQKAGTSTVLRAVTQHPQIRGHHTPELSFFLLDQEYERGWLAAIGRHYGRLDQRLLFAKNVGLLYAPSALQRVHQHNPDIQIFVFLRDPVYRAYSSFNFARQRGWEPVADFAEALEAGPERFDANEMARRNCSYLDRGRYAEYLKHVWRLFPAERVHVFLDSDLRDDEQQVVRRMLAAMSLDPPPGWSPVIRRENTASQARSALLARKLGGSAGVARHALRQIVPARIRDRLRQALNRANRAPFAPLPLDAKLELRLREYYRASNRALEAMIGRDLSDWGT